jgi:hypothetical protein
MSSREIQPKMHFDEIDELIRLTLLDEVAGEEPSPQVWQNIKARIAYSQTMPGPSGRKRLGRQLASAIQTWISGLFAPWDEKWEYRLAPQERAYLIWRETLSLLMMPMAKAIIC